MSSSNSNVSEYLPLVSYFAPCFNVHFDFWELLLFLEPFVIYFVSFFWSLDFLIIDLLFYIVFDVIYTLVSPYSA